MAELCLQPGEIVSPGTGEVRPVMSCHSFRGVADQEAQAAP